MTPDGQQVDESLLERYLLGRLDDAARDRVEERLFSEGAFLERLEKARSGLIDAYANGSLDASTGADFERYVLPMRSARDELLAKTIRDSGMAPGAERQGRDARRRWFWWPALTAAAMAAAAFGVLYFGSQARLRELAQREERLRMELARTGPQAAGQERVLTAGVVRFDLNEDLQVRGEKKAAGVPTLAVPGATEAVEFRVRVPYETEGGYSASLLEIPARRTLWSGKPLLTDGRLLTFMVPRSALTGGPGRLIVKGERPAHDPVTLAEFTFVVRLEP